jgi:hypothetical protein
MRNIGYLLSIFLVGLLAALLVVPFGAAGCNGGSNGGNHDGDAGNDGNNGPECLTDADCNPPETCQPDNTCAYVPDPDDNKAVGNFDLVMDLAGIHGTVRVEGKFDGRYLYLGYGGLIEFNQTDVRTEMQLFGIVTNRLMHALVIYLPQNCPTGQRINISPGGVASGTLDAVELNAEGYESGRSSIGEIIDGYIAFSHYDYNPDARVAGTLEVSFRVVK